MRGEEESSRQSEQQVQMLRGGNKQQYARNRDARMDGVGDWGMWEVMQVQKWARVRSRLAEVKGE